MFALQMFAHKKEALSDYLYKTILGHKVTENINNVKLPNSFKVPGLPKLNAPQVNAVRAALQQSLCLIQGPPGTGKTVTSAAIVYHLIHLGNKKKRPILV